MRTILLTLAMALCLALLPFSAFAQITQLAELTASDGAANDLFGNSAAMGGDTVVVGAPGTAHPYHDEGSAYVFTNSGAQWIQAAELTASDGALNQGLGSSVAISSDGKTVVAGAPGTSFSPGALYVFVESTSGWSNMTETAKLTVSGEVTFLGNAVSISADGAVIAATSHDNSYVFLKPKAGWQNETGYSAELITTGGLLESIAISGATIVAGAYDNVGINGALLVYTWQSGIRQFTPTATLMGSNTACEELGPSVAIAGKTIIGGSPVGGGAVCVYVEPASGWVNMTETAALTIATTQQSALGASVSISGKAILAGAPTAVIGNSEQGAFFGYFEPATGWVNTSTPNVSYTSSDGQPGDNFGWAIAASDSTVVGGAPYHAVNGNVNQGAAYIFGPKP